VVRELWRRWKALAHIIGNVQARILLTVFYFVIVPPFALLVRLFKDPFPRPPVSDGFWIERSEPTPPAAAGRRQF
jgi:hypothetical protein